MRRDTGFLTGFLLLTLLTGCAGMNDFAASDDAPLGTVVDGVDCQAPNLGGWMLPEAARATDIPTHPDAPAPGRVPADFEPTAAYRCTFMATFEDDHGRWSAVKVDRLEGDFSALLAALAEPDDKFGFTQVCTADAEFVPELWLQNAAGQAVRVAWPRDACLKTKPATAAALKDLERVESTHLPISLVATREALDADCSMSASAPGWRTGMGLETFPHGELLEMDATELAEPGSQASAEPRTVEPVEPAVSLAGADGVSVCLYTVEAAPEADPPAESSSGTSLPYGLEGSMILQTGEFTGATTLPADAAARLLGAASAAGPPAASCDWPITRFAVLWPSTAGTRIEAEIVVELDGCARLFTPGSVVLDTPTDVLADLAAL